MIAPSAPGGLVDVVARLIAPKLSEQLGQQFFVENISGAGTNIGNGRAAQAAPDGYTILVGDGISFTANAGSFYRKLPFDAVRDFNPVTVAATTMVVIAIHPSVPRARSKSWSL